MKIKIKVKPVNKTLKVKVVEEVSKFDSVFDKLWNDYAAHRSGWKMPVAYARMIALDFFSKGLHHGK